MRAENNGRKHSALKRIIPAAAMFALSTAMLSTSTYAWFTMNKEVEMTGLAMSATVGEGMEISLAAVDSNPMDASTTPADTDSGWTNSVIVGQYYSKIGKLRPASSTNGVDFCDATDATSKGTVANTFKYINDIANVNKVATIELRDTLKTSDTPTINSDEDVGAVGYYVDIPVYLRTNKRAPSETDTTGDIYCKLKIQKRDESGNVVTTASDDLYKSVRVSFVPTDATSATIFGVNNEYYQSGQAVTSKGQRGTVDVKTGCVSDTKDFAEITGADSGLDISYASGTDKYGHLDFVVRVWIEGESKYCSDDTSGQSWNIDLAFSMGEFASDNTQNT